MTDLWFPGLLVCFSLTELIVKTPTPRPRLKTTTEAPRRGWPDHATSHTPALDRVDQAPVNRSVMLVPATAPSPRPGKGERKGQRRKKKPRNGAVRLMDGGSRGRSWGRVEVYVDGEWGTVCDDGWSSAAAAVVCRQLGFPYVVRASKKAEFGEGTLLRILLDDVQCSGQEKTLLECAHAEVGTHNCSHEEDAGVVCSREEVADWWWVLQKTAEGQRACPLPNRPSKAVYVLRKAFSA